jgi:hypothetical protein
MAHSLGGRAIYAGAAKILSCLPAPALVPVCAPVPVLAPEPAPVQRQRLKKRNMLRNKEIFGANAHSPGKFCESCRKIGLNPV